MYQAPPAMPSNRPPLLLWGYWLLGGVIGGVSSGLFVYNPPRYGMMGGVRAHALRKQH
jgi:hypothetical protein